MAKITEEQAKEVLREKGYYVDNLWHVDDVKSKFKCTDDEAQGVLDDVLRNDWTIEQINVAIRDTGSNGGLEENE